MKRLSDFLVRLGFPPLEGKLLIVALGLAGGHLLLVAFAAYQLKINVPTCLADDPKTLEPSVKQLDENTYQALYVAKMWQFEPSVLRIPTGASLEVFLTSSDVIHGFFVKGTNANLMAIPGTVGDTKITFDKPGTYPIICHEYCGSGHHNMVGSIEVIDGLEGFETEGLPSDVPDLAAAGGELAPEVAKGFEVATQFGCLACHSTNGTKLVGPSFAGIYHRDITTTSGESIKADEEYLKESILSPNEKIVEGFQPNMMPALPLNEEQVAYLLAYLKTLSSAQN